ncbi:MAG: hypothetical protein AAFO78_02920 [Pseudomonadota bacterium]
MGDLVNYKSDTNPTLLDALPFDDFEKSLLPLVRHFVGTLETGDAIECCHIYDRAIQTWGDPVGLSIAHILQKLILALKRSRNCPLQCFYPAHCDDPKFISENERSLLTMLHHMRRDQTKGARDALDKLAFGKRDPKVIQTALTFSNRYAAGAPLQAGSTRNQCRLRVIR